MASKMIIKRQFKNIYNKDSVEFQSSCSTPWFYYSLDFTFGLIWLTFLTIGFEGAFGPILFDDTPPTAVRIICGVWLCGWLIFGIFQIKRSLRENSTRLNLVATTQDFTVIRTTAFKTSTTKYAWAEVDSFSYSKANYKPECELLMFSNTKMITLDSSLSVKDAKRVSNRLCACIKKVSIT